MNDKKTEVYSVSPEELLSKMRVIFENTVERVLKPKKEKPVGVKELSEHIGKSHQWIYKKCDANEIRFYQYGGKNSKLEFFISEVDEDLRKSAQKSNIKPKSDTGNLIP